MYVNSISMKLLKKKKKPNEQPSFIYHSTFQGLKPFY